MLLLLLTLTASAGDPVTAIQELVEHSEFRAATQRCNKLDDDLASTPALQEACAMAHMGMLGDEGDAAAWKALAETWTGTSAAETAIERAAELALSELPPDTAPDRLLAMATAYPGTAGAQQATERAAAKALTTAVEAADVLTYRAFREKYAGTPQADEAREKEAEAALADVEQYDTPLAWRQLRSHYPELTAVAEEREIQAVGRAIAETASLSIPCKVPTASGPDDAPPPRCDTIAKETVISATWTTPEGYTAKAGLVGWDGEQSIQLSSLQRRIGPAPYASAYAQIAVAGKGEATEEGWTMTLPVDLKRPPDLEFRGYAVQIRVLGGEAALLPFVVSEAWEDARRRR